MAIESKRPQMKDFKDRFIITARTLYGRDLNDLSKEELYQTLAATVKQYVSGNWIKTNRAYKDRGVKQVYYFSVEFLLGRLLNTNLVNLGIRQEVEEQLKELGIELEELIPEERDAGLGNGGLGRLAACFIDSMASLGLPGNGCSIRYRYGLFEQHILDGNQVEIPDNWLKNAFAWEYRKPDKSVHVHFGGNAYMTENEDGSLKLVHEGGYKVLAVPYDVPVVGYDNSTVNTLRLWNSEVDEDFQTNMVMTKEQVAAHHQYYDSVQNITKFLYPNDNTYEGRALRLVQEYFFVSAGVQSIVEHHLKEGVKPVQLPDRVEIHINDTHPALCVAEIMRILVDEQGMDWEPAWETTRRMIAYTNHTIMPEALEKWPVEMVKRFIPRIYMIIEEINRRFLIDVRRRYPGDEERVRAMSIIQDGSVHMARLSVVGSHSVNGVAKIHSEILCRETMQKFSEFYPGKFNNKTNGITHRRWLIAANPQLADLLDETISPVWRKAPERLEDLKPFADDASFRDKLEQVKCRRKDELAAYVAKYNDLIIDPESIFDIQVKRIHSYKRQLMNILHIMYQYDRLKNDPEYDVQPITYFFGGKAAPGYYIAKETIRLINAVAKKVNNDPLVRGRMKVVFLVNFGVSVGELVYPAADISEQISTASKEASGTGNMKFMMNGAITLGTMDGANVEICDLVGQDNCVIFGLRAHEVISFYRNGMYSAWNEYNSNAGLRRVVDQLTDGTYGDFGSLRDYLLNHNDEYFILKDFGAYRDAHEEIVRRYGQRDAWLKSSAINIAGSGFFSSDRTIREYARDIWRISPLEIEGTRKAKPIEPLRPYGF